MYNIMLSKLNFVKKSYSNDFYKGALELFQDAKDNFSEYFLEVLKYVNNVMNAVLERMDVVLESNEVSEYSQPNHLNSRHNNKYIHTGGNIVGHPGKSSAIRNENLLLKSMVEQVVDILRKYRSIFISQSHRNNSKDGSTFFELAVVTSAMFEDAMSFVLSRSTVLTYTHVFPSDCRMFISVPIYMDGYIYRKDYRASA
ncbi:uncharacterized protein LOC123553469 isoform X2 [Mercenaria mercenaria]|uniref:uncharacterized protein LOC123553469 isoform X2 n=1 Tax=Mercenaria mercenaria TaxID=6596 RepID=UPI00234EEEC6|nr:uncharacterized protein LOC123553469 isoform X2 [Mercenaria mercenaria]